MFPWSIHISMKQPNFCKKCAYVLLCEAVSLVGHRINFSFDFLGLDKVYFKNYFANELV